MAGGHFHDHSSVHGRRKRPRGAPGRRWGRRQRLTAVGALVGAAFLSQVMWSAAADPDPDCLDPGDVPASMVDEKDGFCPETGGGTTGEQGSGGDGSSGDGEGGSQPSQGGSAEEPGGPESGGEGPSGGSPGGTGSGGSTGGNQSGADRRSHAEGPSSGDNGDGGDNGGDRTNDGDRRSHRGDARRRPRRGDDTALVGSLGTLPAAGHVFMRIPLPDPLPPAKRLDPAFAQELRRAADGANVDWALVLAVLRARDAVPARAGVVRALARRLAKLGAERDPHQAVLRLSGGSSRGSRLDSLELPSTTSFADRVVALAHYNSAVGLQGLVRGLDAVKEQLIERVLDNGRLEIYPGGRADVAGGRTDVRVLVLLLYMAQEYESVTVTSLTSGHGVYTKSGSVSAHSYGRAVDIAAINGTSIMGNQQPGGITEDALRTTMLLPPELRPKQVISLFELGGAFFAMSDHADHIHVGY